MSAILEINGTSATYPAEILNLEKLLLHVQRNCLSPREIVVEVRLDGECYSETYAHEARELSLDVVRSVAVDTHSHEVVAREFITSAPEYLDLIEGGFRTAAGYLQGAEEEEIGYDMMARSIEGLRTFKTHLDTAVQVIGGDEANALNGDDCERLDAMADKIMQAQENQLHGQIADCLNDEMLPLLARWKSQPLFSSMAP